MDSLPKPLTFVPSSVALALCGLFGLFFVSFFDDLPSFSTASSVIVVLAWSAALAALWLSRPRSSGRAQAALFACVTVLSVLAFVAGLYFTDRFPVYAAGLALPVSFVAFGRPRHILQSAPLAASVLGIAAFGLAPAHRLERYSVNLRTGCWCCCVRDRAIVELCSLGPQGIAAIRREVANSPRVGFVLDRNAVLSHLPSGSGPALAELREWLGTKGAF